jgi:hypothetical protein
MLMAATQMIIYYLIFGTAGIDIIIFLIFILTLVTFSCFYAAYRSFLFKTVRIDGDYFYFFHGKNLKKRIALVDINRVKIGPFMFYSLLSFKLITINYREGGRNKTFHISEDQFPFRELQIIFREFTRYTQTHNIMIVPH